MDDDGGSGEIMVRMIQGLDIFLLFFKKNLIGLRKSLVCLVVMMCFIKKLRIFVCDVVFIVIMYGKVV